MVTAAYLEDSKHRLNVFSKQGTGVTSQQEGQIDVSFNSLTCLIDDEYLLPVQEMTDYNRFLPRLSI